MKLIDANALKKAFKNKGEGVFKLSRVNYIIDNAPTVEERPEGEWISVSEGLPMHNGIFDMEELIYALEIGKPAFDGEDTNYDVATIEDAIAIIKKYADIRQKVEEFRRKITREKPIETPIELQMYLKELEAHERCLANQVLNIIL